MKEKIEALEWFFEYVQGHTNVTIESAIDYLDCHNLTEHRIELVKLWEYNNHPAKWSMV